MRTPFKRSTTIEHGPRLGQNAHSDHDFFQGPVKAWVGPFSHPKPDPAQTLWRPGFFSLLKSPKVLLLDAVISALNLKQVYIKFEQSGGPSYPVFLGRRDGMDSKAEWIDLPSPSISWESSLAYFESKGLDVQDMATLLGKHPHNHNSTAIVELYWSFD